MRLLIAEDEEKLARDLKVTLEEAGYEVEVVHEGEAVLKALAQDSFAALMLDLVMPKCNGYEVLLALQDRHDAPPVIVMSNLAHEDDIAEAKRLGAEDYFIKAVHLPNIVNHVKAVLAY